MNELGKQVNILSELQGRTPDQQEVIRYFTRVKKGCFGKLLSDQEYEAKVMKRARSTDFKQKALSIMGLDEEQVKEIEPVHFEGYEISEQTNHVRYGEDKKWRSSSYQISWLFFSSTQVYLYQYTFNLDNDATSEISDEYFYKDITNFSSGTSVVEKTVWESKGCMSLKPPLPSRKQVSTNTVRIVVPGEKLSASMEQSSYTDNAIKGMRAKLREKKES